MREVLESLQGGDKAEWDCFIRYTTNLAHGPEWKTAELGFREVIAITLLKFYTGRVDDLEERLRQSQWSELIAFVIGCVGTQIVNRYGPRAIWNAVYYAAEELVTSILTMLQWIFGVVLFICLGVYVAVVQRATAS